MICVYNSENNISLNKVFVLKKLYTLKISKADPSYEDIYISHKMGVYLYLLLLTRSTNLLHKRDVSCDMIVFVNIEY